MGSHLAAPADPPPPAEPVCCSPCLVVPSSHTTAPPAQASPRALGAALVSQLEPRRADPSKHTNFPAALLTVPCSTEEWYKRRISSDDLQQLQDHLLAETPSGSSAPCKPNKLSKPSKVELGEAPGRSGWQAAGTGDTQSRLKQDWRT